MYGLIIDWQVSEGPNHPFNVRRGRFTFRWIVEVIELRHFYMPLEGLQTFRKF